jgi:nitrogen fixation NifU-like protein
LEEAAKISKTQVVDSLGELPPIKMHCSVLASDALVEAIYDYLSKNKKDISEDLKIKHKRIAKEKEETEERYKDWTDMEKKMLG